jgi:hypothetical protein
MMMMIEVYGANISQYKVEAMYIVIKFLFSLHDKGRVKSYPPFNIYFGRRVNAEN